MGQYKKQSVLLTLLFALCSLVTSQRRVSFGEECGTGTRCNSRASLSCQDGICRCVKPDEMIYDATREKCVVISSERCSYTAMEIQSTEIQQWTQKLDCTQQSFCNEEGYCECHGTHFESSDGLCLQKLGYGMNCTSDTQCQSDKNLLCQDNICSCPKSEAIYDFTKEGCVGLVGSSCSKYGRSCVSNANCNDVKILDDYYDVESLPKENCECDQGYNSSGNGFCLGGYFSKCKNDGECSDEFSCVRGYCRCSSPVHDYNPNEKKCECQQQYFKGENGSCFVDYNQTCLEDVPCAGGLVCSENKCVCPFPSHQYYASYNHKCITYVEGPCKGNFKDEAHDYECVSNAHCDHSSGLHECKCDGGYVESEGRNCKVAHGHSCHDTGECDPLSGLMCNEKICSCPNLQEYDIKSEKCIGLVGSTCNPLDDKFCTIGAICKPFRDTMIRSEKGHSGICRCGGLAELTSDRKCAVAPSSTTDNEDIESADSKSIETISRCRNFWC